MMPNASSPETWNEWFRDGIIREVEFFHGLIACSISVELPQILAVLADDGERERFLKMLRQLASLAGILTGQKVTSVARYELSDACRLLEIASPALAPESLAGAA